ncbi:winged helix-turn-helix transcriptional regulator [Runella zeae]|uniref:winged helix-turn-helix transcriptional regulator n=1 Tax=Runella zeae TaxID=94255 RepID=UPI0003FE5F1F|nr:helix-turn-helix domain-containing protein [Runella zeae]
MTTPTQTHTDNSCPAEGLLKMLTGKWKPQIFRFALEGPVRFNALLRQLEGSNKQSIAVALKEMEEQGLLEKVVVKLKPLHIEYHLSEKGKSLIPIFRQLEQLVFA